MANRVIATRAGSRWRGRARYGATLATILGMVGCQNSLAPDESTEPQAPEGPEFATVTGARTYYVSPSGNDNNAGTSTTSPWRTLTKVSAQKYYPGDRILLQGGGTFSGRLYVDANDKGTPTSPVTISTYGTGRATINAGSGDGVYVYNAGGYIIKNLKVVGGTSNNGTGIKIYTDAGGGVKLDFIQIDNVEASGFGKYGIGIGSWNGTTGYKNVRVTNASLHDNILSGFMIYAQVPFVHQNVYVGYVTAYNNLGKAGLPGPSGSGIVMSGVSGGTVERSIARDNGARCDAGGGPVGIWTYQAEKILIQYNESYRNKTARQDGGGFDLDMTTRYTTVQYNYSHENYGPGFLMAHAKNDYNHTGNIFRYNISENDARRHGAGIAIWGRTVNAEIHNNTVYVSPSGYGTARGVFIHNAGIESQDVKSVHIRNNTFYVTGGLLSVNVFTGAVAGAVDLRFERNNYYGGTIAPKILWAGANYAGIGAWASATGQERVSGVTVGLQVNPGLVNAGGGGTIGNASNLSALTAYKLTSTSQLINKGWDLAQRFGTVVPPKDFYSGATPNGVGYDIGAHEWR
jgi:hypothetical protein